MSSLFKDENVAKKRSCCFIFEEADNATEKFKETLRRSYYCRAICPTLLTMFSCHLSYFARILVLL